MMMILLRITGYGWTAIAFMVLSVLIAVKILKRNNQQAKPGCLGVAYVSLVVFILLSLSATLTGVLVRSVTNTITLPRYKARVTDISSYQDKDSQKRTITMYRSTVTFTTNTGTPVTIETDIASSGKKDIGEEVTVGYQPGMEKAEEMSVTKYLLLGGAAVLLLVMGYFSTGGILYAMGRNMSSFFSFGMGMLLYFIFPLGMLFLFGGMGYALVLYFMGEKPDMPVWAVVVCIFFCLVLAVSMLGYFKMLVEKNKRNP